MSIHPSQIREAIDHDCSSPRSTSSHFSRHAPPRHQTRRMRSSERRTRPAQSEYVPPSPIASCSGTATSAATKAESPRNALFVATADEERPLLASTMYASVLE